MKAWEILMALSVVWVYLRSKRMIIDSQRVCENGLKREKNERGRCEIHGSGSRSGSWQSI